MATIARITMVTIHAMKHFKLLTLGDTLSTLEHNPALKVEVSLSVAKWSCPAIDAQHTFMRQASIVPKSSKDIV